MFSLRASILAILLLLLSFPILSLRDQKSTDGRTVQWTTKPDYETPTAQSESTAFSITDEDNVQHIFYDESHAILIIEGKYTTGGWAAVTSTAKRHEDLLRNSLEKRRFDVLVWRDLKGAQLRTTLTEAFSNFGYRQNTRLFFYYYGHGQLMGADADPAGKRAFLVPVDAPNPLTDEQKFYTVALPVSQIVEFAKQITVKHAFFALEACQAGALIASLSGPAPPYPKGYLLSQSIQRPIRQFLTAGSVEQDVLADSPFTPLLVDALDNGDGNGDGYVTGSEVMAYVTSRVPQNAPYQNPEHGSIPTIGGDMVFGPTHLIVPPPMSKPSTRTEFATRQWVSPELQVGCNQTNSGRVTASVSLNPNLNETVVSVTAHYLGIDKVEGMTGPTIEGPPGATVAVSYGFNGLNASLFGCPGGGHASIIVTFTIEQQVPETNR